MALRGQVFGTDELTQKFLALDEALQGQALKESVLAGGVIFLNAARTKIQDNGLIRTRNLGHSLHQEITERTATNVTAEAGTNVEYAAIHEYGGTLRPKNGKYLAIPVGSLRGSPRQHDLSLRKSAAGNLLLVDASGKPQYVLRESVEIPAKPYMRPAWDENQAEIQGEVERVARMQIMKAVGDV